MPNRKDRLRTEKQINKLTAKYIKSHPGILNQFSKEVIRDVILNGLLTIAFAKLPA
ncbi:hypothetical protein G6K72_000829 [Salmonella enterica subsp. enterica serovar Rubislaw]|nr:hypothetical protein [Salmonella enterica subsp. enterica serovar Rubislaw]